MPDRKFILTTVVVAAILLVSWQIGASVSDASARAVVYACAGLFSFAIIRSTLLVPALAARRWRRYAADRGDEMTVGNHGEPRIVGERNGVRFVAAQSTEMLGGGGGYYARTVVTAAVEEGLPDGLRAYRRDAREWMHALSGLREVRTDEQPLDEALMVEGSDADVTRRWLLERRDVFDELRERFPRFIAYGSEIDGLPVAAGGASGALTVLVVGRMSDPRQLDRLIDDVTAFAGRLGNPTS